MTLSILYFGHYDIIVYEGHAGFLNINTRSLDFSSHAAPNLTVGLPSVGKSGPAPLLRRPDQN